MFVVNPDRLVKFDVLLELRVQLLRVRQFLSHNHDQPL